MITSKKNPRLQGIRDLLQNRKDRDSSGLFVVEGVRLVEEANDSNAAFQEIFYSSNLSERGRRLLENIKSKDISCEEVDASVFLSIMDTESSQGIAAICRKDTEAFSQDINFAIIADRLRDPGNLGTLLRTAAAAGAQAVFTTPESVDLYSPKVVRAAMGAHFHIHCSEQNMGALEILVKNSSSRPDVYVAAANASQTCWDCNFKRPVLLIIGGEADGASEDAFRLADQKILIPMPGKFESLNAAVAAGILIFEVVRQRETSELHF